MSRDPDPQTGFVDFRYSRTKIIRINLGLGRTDVQVPPAPPRPKFWGRIAVDERNGVAVSVEFVDATPVGRQALTNPAKPSRATKAATVAKATRRTKATKPTR